MSTNSVDSGHLRAFIERIERLEEEKRAIADDIKEVYAEAKSAGYDVKIMRKIVSIHRMDPNKRREEEELLEIYLSALGDLADTPLGRAAVGREFGALGTPQAPTDEEKEQGAIMSFRGKDGTRATLSAPKKGGKK